MKRYGDLAKEIITRENLEIATKKAMQGKQSRRVVKRFLKDPNDILGQIKQSLIDRTFTTSTYNVKIIFEPKRREIFVLPFIPDRIVQHALMNVVEPLIDKRFYEYSMSCRPGKGIHLGSKKTLEWCIKNNVAYKFDVSKFYPSIVHSICFDMIESIFKDSMVLWLFDDIIKSIDGEVNIPIGNYCSQWLGNLYLHVMDEFIKKELKVRDYIRYCDDFILWFKEKPKYVNIQQEIECFLMERLQLRLSKSEIIHLDKGEPVDFLGYKHYKDGHLELRDTSKKRFELQLAKIWHDLHYTRIPLPHIRSQVYSLLGWIRFAHDYDMIYRLELYKLEDELAIAEQYGREALMNMRHSDDYKFDPKRRMYVSRNSWKQMKREKKLIKILNSRKKLTEFKDHWKIDDAYYKK